MAYEDSLEGCSSGLHSFSIPRVPVESIKRTKGELIGILNWQ